MMRGLLEWLAWKILRQHVRDHYILRAEVVSYCWWMSRDFPVFVDAAHYLMFYDENGNPAPCRDTLENHRVNMQRKYPKGRRTIETATTGATHES